MQSKSQLAVIFVTIFIYLVGFGVVIPIIPTLASDFGATSTEVGLLLSSYSLMQFLFAPFWGSWSDRIGRRPILLACLLGEVFSYLYFAHATSLTHLFLARLLAGFFGASISTASAAISDITGQENRSRGMALVGAAFGLGFLLGPAIGGAMASLGKSLSPDPHYGVELAAYFVAALCFVSFLSGLKFLKETKPPSAANEERKKRFQTLFSLLKLPVLGSLMTVFFLSTLAMAGMEATLVLLVKDKFGWGIEQISFGFAYIGFISVLNQGFLVRRLLPIFGERQMLVMGLITFSMGLAGIALSPTVGALAVAMTLLSIGYGFTNPSALGSISLLSPKDQQGLVLGSAQGMASLGRIIGPALGGWLFGNVHMVAPFITSGLIVLLGLSLVILQFSKLPNAAQTVKS